MITPEIYWPDNLSSSLAWPELRNFHVKFNRVAPNGDWYFIRDPTQPREEDIDEREETDEEDEFDSDDSDDSYDPLVPDSFYERREERRVGNLPLRFFRTMPDSEKITPFLVAMARAAGQMPKLQRMSLETELVSEGQAHFELQYLAPGQQCDLDSEPGDSEKPRLYLLVGKWRPEEEIIKLWTEHKGVDGDIIVRYLDW